MKVHPEISMKTKGREKTGVRFQVPGVRKGVASVPGYDGKLKLKIQEVAQYAI